MSGSRYKNGESSRTGSRRAYLPLIEERFLLQLHSMDHIVDRDEPPRDRESGHLGGENVPASRENDELLLAYKKSRENNLELDENLDDGDTSQSGSSTSGSTIIEARERTAQLQIYIDKGLNPCPWINKMDMHLVENLGFQDPYYWPSLQDWTESLVDGFLGKRIDMRVLRQRFIRPGCVACRRPCQSGQPLQDDDPPVALPCGHIIGHGCLTQMLEDFTDGHGPESWTCPWKGPRADDPPTWSPACNTRIFHACDHPVLSMRLPKLEEDFYLPEDFFLSNFDGYMPRDCRECSMKNLLTQWTQTARYQFGNSRVFAHCSGIDGLLKKEVRVWGSHPQRRLGEHGKERTEQMATFLSSTPAPPQPYGARPTKPEVSFLAPCIRLLPAEGTDPTAGPASDASEGRRYLPTNAHFKYKTLERKKDP